MAGDGARTREGNPALLDLWVKALAVCVETLRLPERIAVITNNCMVTEGKMMPPCNVLPSQAIHDVLAYLKATFLPKRAPN